VESHRQPGGWLRSSHSFKECVIAHWSSDSAPKMIGAKHTTEALDSAMSGRGAFCTGMKVDREDDWTVQKRECRNE